jgi:hypothetical protein
VGVWREVEDEVNGDEGGYTEGYLADEGPDGVMSAGRPTNENMWEE